MTLYCFLDESYGPDDYYTGAVVATESQYSALCHNLQGVRDHAAAKYGSARDAELHAHRIMHGQDPWSCLDGQAHEAIALFGHALSAIVDSGVAVFTEAVDVRRLNARYKYPQPPHDITLRHTLERVNGFAARQKQDFTVCCDQLDDSAVLDSSFTRYRAIGTPGYRSSKLPNMSGDMRWVDSCLEPGVQAADLCTYIVRRHNEETSAHPRAVKAARRLHRRLRPVVRHHRKWLP